MFPHGIQILAMVDYLQVALVSHCYTDLCVQVAHYGDYVRPMLDHLWQLKAAHWDERIRLLAFEALRKLASFDPEYCRETVFLIFKIWNLFFWYNFIYGNLGKFVWQNV